MTAIMYIPCIRCGGKPKVTLMINDGKKVKVKAGEAVSGIWGFNLTVYLCLKCYREFGMWLKL